MALSKEKVQALVKEYGKSANDTGSTTVQIALITEQVKNLTEHLKAHKKDHHSRRSLSVLVGKRRGLLDYLSETDRDEYIKLIATLGIRK
ncbi:MAG: 30S ribosomal protein S15 [Bacilli bacterium]|jgi:small subunit ribosomal protein S15